MSNYSDSPSRFKFIQHAEIDSYTRRNMAIFAMLLNGIGIPDKFHEFIEAVFVSGNWDDVETFEQITLKRMARNLSSLSNSVFETVYNRLKKNGPAFFKWQDEQGLEIILSVREREPNSLKSKVKYSFPYYPIIVRLFSLDKSLNQKEIRKMVEDVCKTLPRVQKPKRQTRKRRPEALADSAIRILQELKESTTSEIEFATELELAFERHNLKWRLLL